MKKLLIIEDDRILLETASEFLREEGFEVVKASDGETGIENALMSSPDLILCDIYMPGLDGYEVYSKLQSQPATAQIPFIFMTAKAEKEDIRFGMQLGAEDYVTKPIDFLQLKKSIEVRLMKFEQFRRHADLKYLSQYEGELNAKEKALKESEERYRDLVENTGEGLGVVDKSETFTYANPAACEIFGLTSEQLIGKNLLTFLDPSSIEEINRQSALRQEGQKSMYEIEIIRQDGERRWIIVTATPQYDADLNFTSTFGIFRDITARKLAENKVYQSEQRLREIVDLTNDWIWEINPQWKYTYVSQKIFDILGYLPGEMIGKSPFDFLLPEDVISVKEQVRSVVHEFEPLTAIVNRARHKDGHIIYLETSGKAVFDEKGVYQGYRGADRDVSLRKLYERELIIAKEKAEESDKLKSSILANMSHELRTPLNGILGFAEILKEELRDTDYEVMIENIHNSGKRLMSTLNSIITLSQLEAGKINLSEKKIQIDTAVSSVVKSMESLAAEKHIYINTSGLKGFEIITDEHLFKQLLRQILDNAIKFTDRGGITLDTHHAIESNRRWVVVTVSDTGIGIDKTYFNLIFQEFRQVSEGFGRQYQGSGIGLTISKKIIDLLNGMITVESEPGKGSGFSIWLPENIDSEVKQETSATVVMTRPIKADNLPKTLPLILLVEDNAVNKDLTEFFLRKICRVEHASDAETALKMVRIKQYAAILMDINLGYGMNGIEATLAIRLLPGYEKTPVIAVTGYTMEEDMQKLFEAGCTGHISKPFDRQTLVNMIEDALYQE